MKRLLSLILALILVLPCVSMITVNAEGVTGTIEGAKLFIGESLTLNFYATFNVSADYMSMRFYSESGTVVTVKGEYDEENGMHKFPYTLINPQCMTENVKAELLYKGEVIDVIEKYNVKKYCTALVSDGAKTLGLNNAQFYALKKLMADMLSYGSESQKYTGTKTEFLADAPLWVKTNRSSFELPKGTRIISVNSDHNNRVVSVSLELTNVIRLCFNLKIQDSATVSVNGKSVEKTELINNNDGTYLLCTEDIKATEFDKDYNVKISVNGNVVNDITYSVNGYIGTKYTEENISDIVKFLSMYGTSSKRYQAALKNETDGDIDLDEDQIGIGEENLIPSVNSDFTSATGISSTNWSKMGNSITLSIGNDNGNKYLVASKTPNLSNTTYHTPLLNIAPYIKEAGAYKITFKYKLKGGNTEGTSIYGVIRTSGETSFSALSGTIYYKGLSGNGATKDDVWYTYTANFYVQTNDLGKGGNWDLGLHQIKDTVSEICIDDVTVKKTFLGETEPISVNSAESWVANEVLLISEKWYTKAFYDVNVDLILTNGTQTYTIPAFWDGDNSWRARFVCPTEGQWTYTTVCSDTTNDGLHDITNTLICTKYSGKLEIYKHGFVKTEPDTRYFMYADGTPFFYLGDTHWNLGKEPLEITQAVVDKRVEQGFTVWQSEPLGASFKFEDGIDGADIAGLRSYDLKMQYIAKNGLVHANAQFFFPSQMQSFVLKYGGYSQTEMENGIHPAGYFEIFDLSDEAKTELERISRYWVARYSAYPVMWTLGQEVDNDHYWEKTSFSSHKEWSYVNNPYKYVAEYIFKHDPYKSPLTGHMEYASASSPKDHGGTIATNSAFRDVEAHTWYGAQWSPSLTGGSNYKVAKDFWENGQGKPVVNYEGRYCYLWTKNFGARAQGWMAYLNGMFGYGYGAQDTWCYLSDYNETASSNDGVDTITPEDKQNATWEDSMEFSSAYQVGYMRDFFENIVGDWHTLIPRFDNDNTTYLQRQTSAFATVASNKDNTKIVTYFSNFSDTTLGQKPNSPNGGTRTGTFRNLIPNATYNYLWFNPVTGETDSTGTFTANANGEWFAGVKNTCDMVLYIYK